jgi:hypothetical protein
MLAMAFPLNLALAADEGNVDPDRLIGILQKLIGYFKTGLLVVVVGFILFSAFSFLTAAGEEEKLKKAKTTLIYALVAIGLIILASSAEGLVRNIVFE